MTPDTPEALRDVDDGRGVADPDADAVHRFAADYVTASEAIDALLAQDSRDLNDIPGFAALENRRTAALDRLCAARAHDIPSLVAKARVLALRSDRAGVDADPLARGLAADLLVFAAG